VVAVQPHAEKEWTAAFEPNPTKDTLQPQPPTTTLLAPPPPHAGEYTMAPESKDASTVHPLNHYMIGCLTLP
jgi:hypothetical protein